MDVLIVDDEPLVRDVVADDLTDSGFRVAEASGAEDDLAPAAEVRRRPPPRGPPGRAGGPCFPTH